MSALGFAGLPVAGGVYGSDVSPAIGTPSASSLDTGGGGGIFSSITGSGGGSIMQGLSNIGLQWYTAVTKGVQTPLVVPQPVQATPGAATANVINQLTGYLPIIILIIGVLVFVSLMRRR